MATGAQNLRRSIIADLLAVRGHLTTPYVDDPRWTPWSRFVERVLLNVDALTARAESGPEGER